MEPLEQIKQLTEELLQRLEVTAGVTVVLDETGAYQVHLETDETGLIIGYHGRTLESLQTIISLMASKKLGAWVKVYINVGDYREKREEALMLMAQRAAERAIASGKSIELPKLTASERRIIHLTLSGDDRVDTESIGEGKERTLMVKPK